MRTEIFLLAFLHLLLVGCIEKENLFDLPPAVESKELAVEIVAQDLDIPWSLDFLPSGEMIFSERAGKVKILEKGVIHEVKGVAHLGEGGLQGIAVDPVFLQNNFIYLYYTYFGDGKILNKVSRFELKNNSLENETVLLEAIPGNVFHDGGRIKFGPDGLLYITTGDSGSSELAQNKTSLAGKILRMKPDGTIPEGNPFGTFVFSFGHRNPQGISWHPLTGELFATEHGPSKHDEVNLIKAGENYGWPEKLCNEGQESEKFVEAVVCFDEWTMAPSGAAFYSGNRLPLKNHFIYGGLRGEQVRALLFENGAVVRDEELLEGFGRVRDVVEGPDGLLYFATNNTDGRGTPKPGDDKIYRIVLKKEI